MPAASTAVAATAPSTDYMDLLKQTANEWMEDKVPKLAAALAYYTVISLAPLIIMTVLILGFVMPDHAKSMVSEQVQGLTGNVGGEALESILKAADQQKGSSTFALATSIVILIFGASGVFGELQDSLDTIWDVKPRGDLGVWGWIRNRFFSMAMVLGICFLLLVSLFVSTALGAVSSGVVGRIFGDGPIAKVIGFVIDIVLSTGVITVLFAAIFKYLPDVKIAWRDVWLGAFLTAVLFQIGKYVLGLYLSKGGATSNFGPAGSAAASFVALLIWVYYSAQILFFGAEFTQVHVRARGEGLEPTPNALPISEKDRTKQGIPSDRTGGKPGLVAAKEQGAPAARMPQARPGRLPATPQVYNFQERRPVDHTATYVAAGAGLVAGLVGGAYAAIAKKGTPRQMNLERLNNRLRRIETEAGRVSALGERVEKVSCVERVRRLQEQINRAARNASRREAQAHADWRTRLGEYLRAD
jgi:membrane protein